jgi:hypothetical protein
VHLQCEAEGFRGITYFYDRPDVMSKYTVRVEGDLTECPVSSPAVVAGRGTRPIYLEPPPLIANELSMAEFYDVVNRRSRCGSCAEQNIDRWRIDGSRCEKCASLVWPR